MNQKSNPGVVPKGDVSYLRATPGPNFPIPPSPIPGRESNPTPGAPQPHNVNNDWEDRLELQQRELEEARARAAQMEKTMRWWSDCTANWREKWSKVRNERNKARDENRQLRGKLDAFIKELNILKREKEELINKDSVNKISDKQIQQVVENATTSPNQSSNRHSIAKSENDIEIVPGQSNNRRQSSSCESSSTDLNKSPKTKPVNTDNSQVVKSPSKDTSGLVVSKLKDELSPYEDSEGSLVEDRLALLELKLDESQKTISGERSEKTNLTKSLEEVQRDLSSLRLKHEDMKQMKQDLEIQIERLKDQHRDELNRLTSDLEDESSSKQSVDKRLAELRMELERLQKENADEWGKRERLETEKLSLERDNKKLRSQISDLEEQLERKSSHATTVVNKDMKTLQMELTEKTKELADMKHVHNKLKKTLQERVTDVEHSKRRSDQFEMEVKKLRSRVEELKRELASAEDEADTQSNNVRKVQRNNDELQEQVDNLQVQLEHLQSRLRRTSQPGAGIHAGSHCSYSSDLQALEIDDDTDDDFSEGN